MTVEVSPLNVLGGAPGSVTSFQDTFNRASGNLGQNWLQSISPVIPLGNPVTSGTCSIGACVDLAQGMIVSNVGTANPGANWGMGLLAMPIYMSNWGRSQFSEWQIVGLSRVGANDAGVGPAVLAQNSGQVSTGNEKQGFFSYFMSIAHSNFSFILFRGSITVNTAITSGGAASFANGDVVRLEARINAGDVTLTIKKNGVLVSTTVDNAAGRILTGSPGLFANAFDNSAGGSMISQWRNFSGGLL